MPIPHFRKIARVSARFDREFIIGREAKAAAVGKNAERRPQRRRTVAHVVDYVEKMRS